MSALRGSENPSTSAVGSSKILRKSLPEPVIRRRLLRQKPVLVLRPSVKASLPEAIKATLACPDKREEWRCYLAHPIDAISPRRQPAEGHPPRRNVLIRIRVGVNCRPILAPAHAGPTFTRDKASACRHVRGESFKDSQPIPFSNTPDAGTAAHHCISRCHIALEAPARIKVLLMLAEGMAAVDAFMGNRCLPVRIEKCTPEVNHNWIGPVSDAAGRSSRASADKNIVGRHREDDVGLRS